MLARVLQQAAGSGDAMLARLSPRSAIAAQRRGLGEQDHRPWPLPDGPWIQGQTWLDLLFAHWSLPIDALRPAVSAALPLDTFDGRAWLGIAPEFEVIGLRAQGTPPMPGLSRFAETNVRTYTTIDGRPGIHFLSLDAASGFAVATAGRHTGCPTTAQRWRSSGLGRKSATARGAPDPTPNWSPATDRTNRCSTRSPGRSSTS